MDDYKYPVALRAWNAFTASYDNSVLSLFIMFIMYCLWYIVHEIEVFWGSFWWRANLYTKWKEILCRFRKSMLTKLVVSLKLFFSWLLPRGSFLPSDVKLTLNITKTVINHKLIVVLHFAMKLWFVRLLAPYSDKLQKALLANISTHNVLDKLMIC